MDPKNSKIFDLKIFHFHTIFNEKFSKFWDRNFRKFLFSKFFIFIQSSMKTFENFRKFFDLKNFQIFRFLRIFKNLEIPFFLGNFKSFQKIWKSDFFEIENLRKYFPDFQNALYFFLVNKIYQIQKQKSLPSTKQTRLWCFCEPLVCHSGSEHVSPKNVNLIIKCKIQHLNVDPTIKCKICQRKFTSKKKWNYIGACIFERTIYK